MGQRLMAKSHAYHGSSAEQDRQDQEDCAEFFGLGEDATEKDLDNAYRQLARRMHPDKNGGTEEAKQNFQNMKAHYEALKQRRAEANKENQENQEVAKEDEDETSEEKQ